MVRPRGVEPLTARFVVWYSIQLSYGRARCFLGQLYQMVPPRGLCVNSGLHNLIVKFFLRRAGVVLQGDALLCIHYHLCDRVQEGGLLSVQ
jgi:hypothetical protein